MEVKLETNVKDVLKELQKINDHALPEARKQALNWMAEDARKDLLQELGRNFILRKEWYKPGSRYGLNIKFASNSRPEAVIYMRSPGGKDHWIEKHVTGGVKKPISGNFIAIPVKIRPDKRAVIPKGKYPRALLGKETGKKKPFIADIGGTYGIYQRRGKGRRPVNLLYAFKRSVKIRKAWDFFGIAGRSVEKGFREKIERAWRYRIGKE